MGRWVRRIIASCEDGLTLSVKRIDWYTVRIEKLQKEAIMFDFLSQLSALALLIGGAWLGYQRWVKPHAGAVGQLAVLPQWRVP